MGILPSFNKGTKLLLSRSTNGFQVLLSVACAWCIGVKHSAELLAVLPSWRNIHHSFEIIFFCFPFGFYYHRRPWLVSVSVQVCSSDTHTLQSQQGIDAL